jgi:hypothetical protein
MVKAHSQTHSNQLTKVIIMTIQNAPGFAPKSRGKGFAPSKGDRPAAVQPEPADPNQVTQSEAMTIRESVNLAAGTGARALQSLAGRRAQTAETIAAEIARLTDPTLFFAETMTLAAEKIRAREEQVSFELDFFNAAGLDLPTPYSLPPVRNARALGAGQ